MHPLTPVVVGDGGRMEDVNRILISETGPATALSGSICTERFLEEVR